MNYNLQLELSMVRENAIINAVQHGLQVYSEGVAIRHVHVERKEGKLIFSYEGRYVEYIPTEDSFDLKCHFGKEGSISYPMDYDSEDIDQVSSIAANWLILEVASISWQATPAN